ncbi:DUF4406 domain-containing protein [Dactylosporangium sp. CA-139066]|uniref:DUF4406 domain-containing protein n=1 Tax=Dactylosporangium sp. CA-139066 TaxID=3239930 RepID=UPI003D8BCEF6
MSVYIAGPMTGMEDWNFPLFFAVERFLKREGYRPINPAKNDGPSLSRAVANAREGKHPWAYYMRRDMRHLSRADALCLLPGWERSKGATLEHHIAWALEMPIVVWEPFAHPEFGRIAPYIVDDGQGLTDD